MATLEQTKSQSRRQLLEATRAMTAAIVTFRNGPEDTLRGQLLDVYNLGRSHVAEKLCARLDIPAGMPAIVITWPGDDCPAQPHAHVEFSIDAGEPDPDRRLT